MSDFSAALRELRNRDFLLSHKHCEQHWRAEREGSHEKIDLFERRFISRMRKLGIPMFAHCVVRSHAEQERLFAEKRTKARGGESAHNYGMAIDLIHGVKGWDLSEKAWALVGHIGLEIATLNSIKLVWGGDWAFYDPAHFELKDWKALAAGAPGR